MSTQVINTRYEILDSGNPAETLPFVVSKARDREEGRIVTLQVLPAEIMAANKVFRQEFQTAVQEAQRLDYNSILRVYDHGITEEEGDFYLVREFMRGITLQERIRRIAPFTLAVSVDIAVAIAEALVAAQRQGVCHGDLRPGHVLLSPEGQIKVADFVYSAVVATELEDPARLAYLPPEWEHDAPATFGGDVYALGAILYEMLTGAPPGLEESGATSLRAVNQGVPPALDGVVRKALHPNLGIRYRTAEPLLTDLQAVREALRTGKSLAWSPLPEKRTPRPSVAASADLSSRPPARTETVPTGSGKIAVAAQELDEERYRMRERETSAVLGVALKILFVIAVLGVIGLSWYATKFMQPPADIQVPNLIGKTFDDAKRIAQQDHFTLIESTNSDYSDSMPENQIYQQDPLPGHTIKEEKEVTVYRSLGPRLLTVPALVGTTQDYATNALKTGNLPLGNVTQEYSDSVPSGVVISQAPEQDSRVARNTAVNFVVSKGKQPPDAPTGVQADAIGPDKVELTWQSAPRAQSYTVLRSLDGDVTTVARALADTKFTDTDLTPETTYSYTINSVNSAGESGPSESALVTTQAKPDVQPVLPPDTVVTPPDVSDTAPAPDIPPAPAKQPETGRLRQFTVDFHVPRRPHRTRHVQIEIQDITGTNLVYDENHEPGDEVSAPLQGIGNKITFRIFLDSKLAKQQTF